MDAEEAVHAADKAAHHAADEASDWTRRLGAHIRAVRNAIGDALCLRRQRITQRCSNKCC